MSDQKKDEELDDVSGGARTNPTQPIPIDPVRPPTHPGGGAELPITRPTNPIGPG